MSEHLNTINSHTSTIENRNRNWTKGNEDKHGECIAEDQEQMKADMIIVAEKKIIERQEEMEVNMAARQKEVEQKVEAFDNRIKWDIRVLDNKVKEKINMFNDRLEDKIKDLNVKIYKIQKKTN